MGADTQYPRPEKRINKNSNTIAQHHSHGMATDILQDLNN